jgi:hypothetical protein
MRVCLCVCYVLDVNGNHNFDFCASVMICGQNYCVQIRSNLNALNVVNVSPVNKYRLLNLYANAV